MDWGKIFKTKLREHIFGGQGKETSIMGVTSILIESGVNHGALIQGDPQLCFLLKLKSIIEEQKEWFSNHSHSYALSPTLHEIQSLS